MHLLLLQKESTIFITEGDSASGSITKARNVETQAVFSLRGKPLNCFSLTKKVVYENEEFNLLQHALNIEEGLEGLRYNNIVIATDADVDGMHIRLLLMTFFLQFFPDLVKHEQVYMLETPLFRVRNKQETIYCYDENEKQAAIKKLGSKPEITRFKGLGEISPDEFAQFIGAWHEKTTDAFRAGRSYSAITGILYGEKYHGETGVYYWESQGGIGYPLNPLNGELYFLLFKNHFIKEYIKHKNHDKSSL